MQERRVFSAQIPVLGIAKSSSNTNRAVARFVSLADFLIHFRTSLEVNENCVDSVMAHCLIPLTIEDLN